MRYLTRCRAFKFWLIDFPLLLMRKTKEDGQFFDDLRIELDKSSGVRTIIGLMDYLTGLQNFLSQDYVPDIVRDSYSKALPMIRADILSITRGWEVELLREAMEIAGSKKLANLATELQKHIEETSAEERSLIEIKKTLRDVTVLILATSTEELSKHAEQILQLANDI